MKEKLQSLDFVDEVLWMDDQLDLATPLELQDKKIVEGFLKGGIALFQLTISDDVDVQEALIELENVVGETGHIRGEVVEQSFMQRAVTSEMTMIVAVVIPAALIILLLSTTSWLEPILFMIVISAGVLINMGLNSFAPDVSFITQAVSSVLQLGRFDGLCDLSVASIRRIPRRGDRAEGSNEAGNREEFRPCQCFCLDDALWFSCSYIHAFRYRQRPGTRTCTRCSGQSPYRLSVVACARAVELQID